MIPILNVKDLFGAFFLIEVDKLKKVYIQHWINIFWGQVFAIFHFGELLKKLSIRKFGKKMNYAKNKFSKKHSD